MLEPQEADILRYSGEWEVLLGLIPGVWGERREEVQFLSTVPNMRGIPTLNIRSSLHTDRYWFFLDPIQNHAVNIVFVGVFSVTYAGVDSYLSQHFEWKKQISSGLQPRHVETPEPRTVTEVKQRRAF